mmetsp:Transcript_9637/g.29023  ORF Transcript_9637/g.29023 Transcript_9637/m.29023 type:complete len:449 (-) Transcript_9637:755-2101(-)
MANVVDVGEYINAKKQPKKHRSRSPSPVRTASRTAGWATGGGLLSSVEREASSSAAEGHTYVRGWAHAALVVLIFSVLRHHFVRDEDTRTIIVSTAGRRGGGSSSAEPPFSSPVEIFLDPVLVSYSYFEKDDIQRTNFEFFMAVGMGMDSSFTRPHNTDFTVVVSGDECAPCQKLMLPLQPVQQEMLQPGVSKAMTGPGLAVLYRSENIGMDVAAHNITLAWTAASQDPKKYKYYIFLNSSTRGPFLPSYLPPGFQWTQAFTGRLTDTIKVVAASLSCLPEAEASGRGPRVESWAYAIDNQGLEVLREAGTFWIRECKYCLDGIVVVGEYGIGKAMLAAGYNMATLMSRYANGVDWRDESHWNCNDMVHASRAGTYDGITPHPFETVFVKSSWYVGEPFTSHYTRWFQQHAQGQAGTQGSFDETLFWYVVSGRAQEPRDFEQCYKPDM